MPLTTKDVGLTARGAVEKPAAAETPPAGKAAPKTVDALVVRGFYIKGVVQPENSVIRAMPWAEYCEWRNSNYVVEAPPEKAAKGK